MTQQNGYLLDTNAVGHWFTGNEHVCRRIDALPDDTPLWISAVTMGEIEFGHRVTESTDESRRDDYEAWVCQKFRAKRRILPITRDTWQYYGPLRAVIFHDYPPQPGANENRPESCFDTVTATTLGIDENDLWIAAQAIEHVLVLVTQDGALHSQIKGAAAKIAKECSVAEYALEVEDWTRPP